MSDKVQNLIDAQEELYPTMYRGGGRPNIPASLIPELVEWLMSDRQYAGSDRQDIDSVGGVFYWFGECCEEYEGVTRTLTAALEAFNERDDKCKELAEELNNLPGGPLWPGGVKGDDKPEQQEVKPDLADGRIRGLLNCVRSCVRIVDNFLVVHQDQKPGADVLKSLKRRVESQYKMATKVAVYGSRIDSVKDDKPGWSNPPTNRGCVHCPGGILVKMEWVGENCLSICNKCGELHIWRGIGWELKYPDEVGEKAVGNTK